MGEHRIMVLLICSLLSWSGVGEIWRVWRHTLWKVDMTSAWSFLNEFRLDYNWVIAELSINAIWSSNSFYFERSTIGSLITLLSICLLCTSMLWLSLSNSFPLSSQCYCSMFTYKIIIKFCTPKTSYSFYNLLIVPSFSGSSE